MRLTDKCYAVTGLYFSPPWTVNAGFIVGEQKTLVIDSGSNSISAQTIYGYASAIKQTNELALINTEKHLDHIGGNSYFYDKNVDIYGHLLINRKQKEFDDMINEENMNLQNELRRNNNEGSLAYQNTRVINPNNRISKDFIFELGGSEVRVIMTPGHTETNLSVFNEKAGVLFCGDCLLPGFLPNLEEGSHNEWNIWIKSLETIKNLDCEIVVPGHGEVIFGKETIAKEIQRTVNYINSAIQENDT